jgi:hypothetical protein
VVGGDEEISGVVRVRGVGSGVTVFRTVRVVLDVQAAAVIVSIASNTIMRIIARPRGCCDTTLTASRR